MRTSRRIEVHTGICVDWFRSDNSDAELPACLTSEAICEMCDWINSSIQGSDPALPDSICFSPSRHCLLDTPNQPWAADKNWSTATMSRYSPPSWGYFFDPPAFKTIAKSCAFPPVPCWERSWSPVFLLGPVRSLFVKAPANGHVPGSLLYVIVDSRVTRPDKHQNRMTFGVPAYLVLEPSHALDGPRREFSRALALSFRVKKRPSFGLWTRVCPWAKWNRPPGLWAVEPILEEGHPLNEPLGGDMPKKQRVHQTWGYVVTMKEREASTQRSNLFIRCILWSMSDSLAACP